METLLPSEIARLVLGYLEDQKCTDAAKMFLETSPHLQECRTVMSTGRRFSTRVAGLTLVDVIEKFFAVNAVVHGHLLRTADCQRVKQGCNLTEQLKLCIRKFDDQRVVVDVPAPSPNNTRTCNGSPIISSSIRKRHHGSSDHARCAKATLYESEQLDSCTLQVPSIGDVETTPLESLPGHISVLDRRCISEERKRKQRDTERRHSEGHESACNRENDTVQDDASNDEVPAAGRCTAATSAAESSTYACAEVQTTPYDTPESESEINDGPIENLSLLTKELLNRTELQERIAENINKAILPADASSKDESWISSSNCETNTSVMVELNNAIKSIVEATEADPIFEKFLDEIIGSQTETDASPDEEVEAEACSKSTVEVEPSAVLRSVGDVQGSQPVEVCASSKPQTPDVPLEQTLARCSELLRPPAPVEEERRDGGATTPSASNASVVRDEWLSDDKLAGRTKSPLEIAVDSTLEKRVKKKSTVRRIRPTMVRGPRVSESAANDRNPETTVMTTPTLIVCSKDDIGDMLSTYPCPPARTVSSVASSRYIPIVPKDPAAANSCNERGDKYFSGTLYLKAVNVVQKVVPALPRTSDDSSGKLCLPSSMSTTAVTTAISFARPTISVQAFESANDAANGDDRKLPKSMASPTISGAEKATFDESITLYANESNAKTLLDSSSVAAMINIEDNVSLSASGLSPYIKFNCSRGKQNLNLSDIDLTFGFPNAKPPETSKTKNTDDPRNILVAGKTSCCDVIDKRTPRSLLRSRSKNHRLSLSTPRKRSSHVRALDFGTPMKETAGSLSCRSSRENGETLRRTSLFASPPFVRVATSTQEIKAPRQSSAVNSKCRSAGGDAWDADLRKALHVVGDDGSGSKNEPAGRGKDGVAGNACTSSIDEIAPGKKKRSSRSRSSSKTNGDGDGGAKSRRVQASRIREGAEGKETATATVTATVTATQASTTATSVGVALQPPVQVSKVADLETPRKLWSSFDVPPTPRLLSPCSSTTPFVKSTDDSSKMRGFINTPEFPKTPCITLTPKVSEQIPGNVEHDDAAKTNEAFATCSPYYKPSFEQNGAQKASLSSSRYGKQSTPHDVVASANTYQACVSAKLEITQFEVIKENLPKEETTKELKIASNSRDSSRRARFEADDVQKVFGSTAEDSDDSDSSTFSDNSASSSATSSSASSSSSSSSSASSSRSSSALPAISSNLQVKNPREPLSTSKSAARVVEKSDAKAEPDDDDDVAAAAARKCESSPTKVFSATKIDGELQTKETPAKSESTLNEIDISETPSSSKIGVESGTNLSSKISALRTTDRDFDLGSESPPRKLKQKRKTKTAGVQQTRATSALPASKCSKPVKLPSGQQKRKRSPRLDEKFVVQLEAKRQRVIAKFQEMPKRNCVRGKAAQGRKVFKMNGRTVGKTTAGTGARYMRGQKTGNSAVQRRTTTTTEKKMKDSSGEGRNAGADGELKSQSDANVGEGLAKPGMKEEFATSKKEQDKESKNGGMTDSVVDSAVLSQDSKGGAATKSEKEGLDYRSKTKDLLKLRVDQVKRDLFSDEETDQHKAFDGAIEPAGTEGTDAKVDDARVDDEVVGDKPKDLSCVLQCLHLVPTLKPNSPSQCRYGKCSRKSEDSETTPNTVEYRFLHEEAATTTTSSVKKRKRRPSGREVNLQINVVLNDENRGEYVKVLKAIDYEEMFSLAPRSKKRLGNGKSPGTRANGSDSSANVSVADSLPVANSFHATPLATSSPVFKEVLRQRVSFATDDIPPDTATPADDGGASILVERIPNVCEDATLPVKLRKRKTSEGKESKQIEKRQRAADPQTLLRNLDLDKFLTTVHGPA